MLSGHPDIAKLCGNSHSEHSWTKNIHYNGRYNSPWFISHSIAYTSLLFIDVLDYQIENEQQTRLMPPPWESITNVNAILIILIDALNLPLECEAPRKKQKPSILALHIRFALLRIPSISPELEPRTWPWEFHDWRSRVLLLLLLSSMNCGESRVSTWKCLCYDVSWWSLTRKRSRHSTKLCCQFGTRLTLLVLILNIYNNYIYLKLPAWYYFRPWP